MSKTWGKGNVVTFNDGRAVRTCVSKDGNSYLLEFTKPLEEDITTEEAQTMYGPLVQVRDGKLLTAVFLTPEAFCAMLSAGTLLYTRIMKAPANPNFEGEQPCTTD